MPGRAQVSEYKAVNKPLAWFKANPENYRAHPDAQIAVLGESLQRFGIFRNVVARPDGTVLAGHGILAAAQAQGLAEFPVVVFDGTDAEARALMVADNEQARLAQDDPDQLSQLLESLQAEGMMQVTGHDEDSLAALLAEVAAQAPPTGFVPEEDPGPGEPPEDPVTQPGDVWVMGAHRLVCGDSTDEESYAWCPQAQLIATSPPYAEQREYELDSFDWASVVPLVIATACNHLAADGSALVNLGLTHKDGRVVEYWRPLLDMMESQGRPLFGWYVWDKLNGMPGDWNGRLAPAHEWVFHFANKPRHAAKTEECKLAGQVTHAVGVRSGLRAPDGVVSKWSNEGQPTASHKIPDSVIRCNPAKGGSAGHPAPYSVEFAAALVKPYASTAEVVIEPFCGSGTTIVACEQLGRACYGIEIEPAYCDVAVTRWQKLTSKPAVLEATGETFDELKARKGQ